MSKTKIIFIFSIVIIVIGSILTTLGFINGGVKSITLSNNGFEIYNQEKLVQVNDDLSIFDSIEISSNIIDINIIPGDKFRIEMVYPKSYGEIQYSVQDNKLIIEEKKHTSKINISFGFINTINSYINIYVPSDAKFDVINLKSSSSDLNIKSIKANEIKINYDYGDVTLNNIEANSIKFDMNSSDLNINNLISQNSITIDNLYGDVDIFNSTINTITTNQNSGSLEIKTSKIETSDINNKYGDVEINDITSNGINITNESGDIDISGELSGNTIIDTQYGEVDIKTTLKEDGYSYSAYSKYGDVSINNNSYENNISTNNSDHNINNINATSQSGDIDIKFNN